MNCHCWRQCAQWYCNGTTGTEPDSQCERERPPGMANGLERGCYVREGVPPEEQASSRVLAGGGRQRLPHAYGLCWLLAVLAFLPWLTTCWLCPPFPPSLIAALQPTRI